jgi:hypothetical protein
LRSSRILNLDRGGNDRKIETRFGTLAAFFPFRRGEVTSDGPPGMWTRIFLSWPKVASVRRLPTLTDWVIVGPNGAFKHAVFKEQISSVTMADSRGGTAARA